MRWLSFCEMRSISGSGGSAASCASVSSSSDCSCRNTEISISMREAQGVPVSVFDGYKLVDISREL